MRMTATASTWSRKSPESADLVGDAAHLGLILSYHGLLQDGNMEKSRMREQQSLLGK